MDDRAEIRKVLASVFGTEGRMEDEAANRILARMMELGWAPPDVVRAMVAGAGGEIRLPVDALVDPPVRMWMGHDPMTGARILRVRQVGACPAHGSHPHNGNRCLDCSQCVS